MITVRPPIALDAPDMARLLNEIIDAGGMTAISRPVTGTDLIDWQADGGEKAAWHVALDGAEKVVGFQWIEPNPSLPSDACDIATFVQMGQSGLGIGSALFAKTVTAARALGYVWINANIRADNEGGLIYYQSRGFEDYHLLEGHTLREGQVVNKRLKRFTL